jgi:hypothetical protein
MKTVKTRKFLEPCKLFVSPSQKAADTEHVVRCLFIAGNHVTGVALESSSKEERGQIFAAMSTRAWSLNHVHRPNNALRKLLRLCS